MKDSSWKKLEDDERSWGSLRGWDFFSRDGAEVPFLSSMVTVSLAHFMRNLAVGVSC